MYGSRIDVAEGLVVGLFSGDHNEDDDYQRYIDSLIEGDRLARPDISKIVILVVDRENPAPNAQWRKKIADATNIGSTDVLFILCAESPIVRGVVIAINWVRPPKYEVEVVAKVDAMLAIVTARRPHAGELVRKMLGELRRDARAAR